MGLIDLTDPVNDTLADATLIANNNALLEALLNGNIDAANIAPGSITSTQLAANAVGAGSIADGSMTTAKLADGAVTSAKILDGTIATADIADGAVTLAKLVSTVQLSLRAVVGQVNSGGTIGGGTGFSVVHGGTGTYQVTITSAFSAGPVVVVTPLWDAGGGAMATVLAIDTSHFNVLTYFHNGTATDYGFYFIARELI